MKTNNQIIEPKLLTVEELSKYISMPVATIYTKKCKKEFPEGSIVLLDGKLRFYKEKIDDWINDCSC